MYVVSGPFLWSRLPWVWNLRLELGHMLESTPLRTTEFAPPITEATREQAPVQGYDKPPVALRLQSGAVLGAGLRPRGRWDAGLSGEQDVAPAPSSATKPMAVCASSCLAKIRDCRGCPKRLQCQWHGQATTKPRRISVLLHPLRVGPAPLLWRDWSRREHRRACMQLVRHQRIEVSLPPAAAASPRTADVILSRAQRAHARLSWAERFARNACPSTAGQVTMKLFGIPELFAASLSLATA